MLVVLNGITNDILPAINVSKIPNVNYEPIGPHPIGSYEVWTTIEYVGIVLSWFMLNRQELTILLHPLTNNEAEDHYGRSMWLGPSLRLDFTVLNGSDLVDGGSEYPELQIGYNFNDNSPYTPQNWLKN